MVLLGVARCWMTERRLRATADWGKDLRPDRAHASSFHPQPSIRKHHLHSVWHHVFLTDSETDFGFISPA